MTARRHIYKGNELFAMFEDAEGALEEYRKALEIDPTMLEAYLGIGRVHLVP